MTLFNALALELQPMAHTVRDKKKLLNRVRRIRGQIDAVEKASTRSRTAPRSC